MSSRVIGLPPRVQIRQQDDELGSYPNAKYLDIAEEYREQIAFDDRQSIVFGRFPNIHYPNALVTQSFFDTAGSTIVASGSQTSGISDTGYKFLQRSDFYPSDFGPYNESNLVLDDSTFAMTGTNVPGLQGWSERLGNKICITVDVSAKQTATISRPLSSSLDTWTTLPFSTGFCYFNFRNRTWDPVGDVDILTNNTGLYTSVLSSSNYQITPVPKNSGLAREITYPAQFSSPNMFTSFNKEYTKTIGQPTDVYGAPKKPIYHAELGQYFSMSNKIFSPFVLEKIRLTIPISATKTYGWDPSKWSPEGWARYLDNYVFFLYRQREALSAKTFNDVASGSQRFLIASASVAVVNPSAAAYSTVYYQGGEITEEGWPEYLPGHSPAATIVMNTGSNDAILYGTTTATKTLVLDLYPAAAKKQYSSVNFHLSRNMGSSSIVDTDRIFLQNAWQGGSTSGSPLSQSFFLDSTYSYAVKKSDCLPGVTASIFLPNSSRISNILRQNDSDADSRFILNSVGSGDISRYILSNRSDPIGNNFFTVESSAGSKTSPYVLFPQDNLVLGIDAGISPTYGKYDPSGLPIGDTYPGSITGSFMQILQGPATMQLFGSLLRENKPIPYNLGQNLTSNALHESMHSDNPILDQFDIFPTADYSGSYVAEIFNGDIGGARRALYSAEQGPTGSISRFVRMESNEVYWDSITPDPVKYAVASFSGTFSDFVVGQVSFMSGTLFEPRVDNNVLSGFGSKRFNSLFFPYERDDFPRKQKSPFVRASVDFNNSSRTINSFSDFKRIVFTRGWGGLKDTTPALPVTMYSFYEGGSSLRYGLVNYQPSRTTAVFRRDKFGNLRDMLEQRQFTTFETNEGFSDPAVYAMFVSASSETIVDPEVTQCSNISQYATSSVPYFDGIYRNRASFPSASLNQEFKPSLVLT